MRRLFLWVLLVGLASTVAQVFAIDPKLDAPPASIESITAREIGGHLRFLASDLMKGRDTASPEIRLAGEYLAAHLYAAGAQPLGDQSPKGRTYFQRFPLEVVTPLSQGSELTLTLDLGGAKRVVSCKLGEDYVLRPHGVIGGEIEADVVFVGYGRDDPEKKIDDYAGLIVEDRFVLVFEGNPGDAPAKPGETAPFTNPFAKREAARKHGALGVLVIQPPGRNSTPPRIPFSARNLGFDEPNLSLAPSPSVVPVVTLADPIRDLLESSLKLQTEGDSRPKAPHNALRVRFRHAVKREAREDRNVLGFMPGVDPKKKNEVVVFSAHYDHEGVNAKGEIFNGSDDNASGTSAVLEIAEAFGLSPRPARSVAFLWVSGEEKGLLGSEWYADHRILPDGAVIVADINLDMVSRNDSKKIGVTPSPKHADYNSLIPAAREACKIEGLEAVFDTDPFYGRTDSFNFAKKGIPIVFFFSGIHEDYHRPTDDFEKADLEKAAHVARAAFRLGWKTAQDEAAPKKIPAPVDEKPDGDKTVDLKTSH
ncbi:M20/M25/M40 family metallo-hydrolase [Paludisphaera borealis]|uniref:Aminopeptidase YwaD n=1 Tax=Paludisphaera borealis TaxID=1387353 RepID=A0A1U7CXG0_9BACT|nr:M20/M25/M40 family metallo-hydrolase [Paludisphaera borealis]APW63640.1 Aminopeptidase YwaD [Paludisphaera borealis]